ncbi:MAG: hypothetical protein IJ161_06265 [Bacteroidales bacterium]|nr:hypothetical protein [Bacteroidales bacterium]
MKQFLLLLSLLLITVPFPDGDRYKLGAVNGKAELKSEQEKTWQPISNDKEDMVLSPRDLIHVIDGNLFVWDGKKEVYQIADVGTWSVEQIAAGKAYDPKRTPEKDATTVKGVDANRVYFDILVDGKPTTHFHFGDRPKVRVINDSDTPVYFTALWVEGYEVWRMIEPVGGVRLDKKESKLLPPRKIGGEDFIISPPAGDGQVRLYISDKPFTGKDVEEVVKKGEVSKRFRMLYKDTKIVK